MLIDFQESHSNVSFEADICIIGAGAAGISIACSICNSLKVIVIESGGYHPSPDMDPFLQGEIIGHNFTGLTEGRVRALGGTTRRWSGGCIRFDSIDFQKRDWVPYSGWPIEYDNISLYYRRAEEFLGLSRTIRPSAAWRNI